jgi:nucleoside 2-deoxyribosyltransferase
MNNVTPRFYLASRYSRREELLGVRDVIESLGGEVTSRWLNGDHQIADGEEGNAASHGERFALEDMNDLNLADIVLVFTEKPRETNSRGGRHVEFGMALALNKHVIVIGPRENVFTWLPQVEWHPDWSRGALSVTNLVQTGL